SGVKSLVRVRMSDAGTRQMLGTARLSPPNPASLRSPVGVSEFRDVSPRTRRRRFLRAERMLGWVVVSDGAAQQKGCVVEGQMGAAGIAVGGGCLSAVLARLGCTRRGWSGPPLGLLPQNAGQSEGQG
ncbi:MAG: hypothetical protein WKF77_02350, partial [Planctomycetaceae bacterium]